MRNRISLMLGGAFACAALYIPCVRSTFGDEPRVEAIQQEPLKLTSEPAADVTVLPGDKRTTVEWDGQDYDVRTGISILMRVILEDDPASGRRLAALNALHVLHGQTQDTDCVEQLVALYPSLDDTNEKSAVLVCLATSNDVRALPLFHRALSAEEPENVRFIASSGLAQWNIRAGVEELVTLLESKSPLPNNRLLRDEAFKVFAGLNSKKGWGFSEPDVREAISREIDLNESATADLWIRHINDWFGENRLRFPDWNLGDPLPLNPNPKTSDAKK